MQTAVPTIDIAFVAAAATIISILGTLGINALSARRKAIDEEKQTVIASRQEKTADTTALIDNFDKLCARLTERLGVVDSNMEKLEARNRQQETDAAALAIEVRKKADDLATEVRNRAEALALAATSKAAVLAESVNDSGKRVSELERHTGDLQKDVDMANLAAATRAQRITELETHAKALKDEKDAAMQEMSVRDARITELEADVKKLQEENDAAQEELARLRADNERLRLALEEFSKGVVAP